MIVGCKESHCVYWDKNFCSKAVVNIDQNGMCRQRWRRAQPIQEQIPAIKGSKIPIVIETIDVNESMFVNQQERKDAGTHSEDPLNGVAANEQRTEKKNDEKKDVSEDFQRSIEKDEGGRGEDV